MVDEGMGARLRALRSLLDLTQAEAAARAGVSKSLLSKVEAGHRRGTWELAVAVARAFHVDAGALMGHRAAEHGDAGRIAEAIPAIRRVLAEYDYPPELPAPPRALPALAADVEHAAGLRMASQYVILAETIPALIAEATAAVHQLAGRERRQAYWLLAAAYRCADAVAFKTSHLDLSALAVDRIRWAAERSEDDLMVGTAAYVRGQNYLVTGAFASGLRALTAAGAELERAAPADVRTAAVYGAIHMRAAVLAARGGLAAAAWSHCDIAQAMAAAVGRDVEYYYTSFGPSNAKIHEVAVAVELGDQNQALARAAGFAPPPDLPAERASHFLIDLARAQLWAGDHKAALRSLGEARRRAPQHTRTNGLAKETIAAIVRRDTRRPDSIVGMATWMGIPI